MAVDNLDKIAAVCLAGESHLTWVVSDLSVEPDSLVVVETQARRQLGRVRVRPGGIVAGTVDPAGRIISLAEPQEVESLAPTTSRPEVRVGGIGKLRPQDLSPESNPLLREFHSALPRLGDRVHTHRGDGVVTRLDVPEGRMIARLDSGEEIELSRDAASTVPDDRQLR